MAHPSAWHQIVTYGAVGGTQAADLMSFPPAGFRPYEKRSRIGHGSVRWDHAWQGALTWGIQRNSGFAVREKESPPEVMEGTYTPVAFDSSGTPLAPEPLENDEVIYGADGLSFIAPGDTAELTLPPRFFGLTFPCRVIYVIDEPNRKGFAYGTLPGHPVSGEESFIVDQTDDGSVWLTIRSFSRPSSWRWWVVYPLLRLAQAVFTRRYFRSLSAPRT